jgi:hypothetical protein
LQSASTNTAEPEFTDSKLFREACYINGQWVQAESIQLIAVDDPATG